MLACMRAIFSSTRIKTDFKNASKYFDDVEFIVEFIGKVHCKAAQTICELDRPITGTLTYSFLSTVDMGWKQEFILFYIGYCIYQREYSVLLI
jgi:hypothetical protein